MYQLFAIYSPKHVLEVLDNPHDEKTAEPKTCAHVNVYNNRWKINRKQMIHNHFATAYGVAET